MKSVAVIIASRKTPTYAGGLANYQRCLARELNKSLQQPVTFCTLEEDPAEGRAIQPMPEGSFLINEKVQEPHKIWMSMAARPWLHALLQKWIEVAYRPALREIEDSGAKVIHYVGTGWDFVGFAMHDLARRTGAKFTIWPAVHPGQWGDDEIDIRLYRLADAVFCQSDSEKNHIVKAGVEEGKIVRCGLPPMCRADGEGQRLRERLGVGNRPVVLFLGHREKGKGYAATLQAWPRIVAECPDAVLLLAGPGSMGDTTVLAGEAIRDLGIPEEDEKADALAACDVFCLPSAHESFGIVYTEAWSYGKPVVCGPAPASRELVRQNETGLWAEQTAESIAEKVLCLVKDAGLRKRLGEAGRQYQQTHLTWEAIVAIHKKGFGL